MAGRQASPDVSARRSRGFARAHSHEPSEARRSAVMSAQPAPAPSPAEAPGSPRASTDLLVNRGAEAVEATPDTKRPGLRKRLAAGVPDLGIHYLLENKVRTKAAGIRNPSVSALPKRPYLTRCAGKRR